MSLSSDMGAAASIGRADEASRAFVKEITKTLNRALGMGGYDGIHMYQNGEAKFYVTEGNPPKFDQGHFAFGAHEGNYSLQYIGRGEHAPEKTAELNKAFQNVTTAGDFIQAMGNIAKAYWADNKITSREPNTQREGIIIINKIDAALSRFSQEHISPDFLTLQN